MEFSELMRAERKAQLITLRSLCIRTEIDFYKLSDFDSGRAIPDQFDKNLICKALGIYHQDHPVSCKSQPAKREYRKYEFCKDIACFELGENNNCQETPDKCTKTAKEFHHWLNENGFEIVKKDIRE